MGSMTVRLYTKEQTPKLSRENGSGPGLQVNRENSCCILEAIGLILVA